MVKKKENKNTRLEDLRQRLNSEATSVEDRRRILVTLAHMGNSEANEIIQKYQAEHKNEKDADLESFAELALEEGSFMAATPEELTKKAVWDQKSARLIDDYAKLEGIECQIDDYQYELEVVKRLAKKVVKSEKETWEMQTMVLHDLLIMEENSKERLLEDIKIDEAIVKEIETELPKTLQTTSWQVGR